LVYAITHNVRYLGRIHESNSAELKTTKERLETIEKWNEKLQEENYNLKEEVE